MKKIIITLFLSLVVILTGFQSVQALDLSDAFKNPLKSVGDKAGFDSTKTDIKPVINTIISVVLSFLGIIFLMLSIFSGLMWMTSAGNPEKIAKAQKIMAAAIIGLITVILAYATTYIVIKTFGEDTGLLTLNDLRKLI